MGRRGGCGVGGDDGVLPGEGRAPLARQLAEAGGIAGVAGGPPGPHAGQEGVTVTVGVKGEEVLVVPGGGALVPEFPAGAGPVVHLSCVQGLLQGCPIRPGHHEDLPGFGVLGHHRKKAPLREGEGVQVGQNLDPAIRHPRLPSLRRGGIFHGEDQRRDGLRGWPDRVSVTEGRPVIARESPNPPGPS